MLSARTTWHYDPHLATMKKNSVHFDSVSFTEVPVKTESNSFKTFISASFLHLHVSADLFTTQIVGKNESLSSENPLRN